MEVTLSFGAVLGAALATLVAAAFVLFLDFSQRVHRAFALLLVLRALVDGLLFFNPTFTNLPGRLRVYGYIALPFAALYFALVYRRRHSPQENDRERWPAWVMPVIGAAIFEIAYIIDHSWYGTPFNPGPLYVFYYLGWPTFSLIALVFANDLAAARQSHQQKALLRAAVGFTLAPLFWSSFSVAFLLAEWSQDLATWGWNTHTREFLAFAVTLLLSLEVVRRIAVGQLRRGEPRLGSAVASCLAFGTGVGIALTDVLAPSVKVDLYPAALALWAFGLPLLVTAALVRHRLFDAEVRLRFAIKGTTIAAVFVGTFFVVAKLTESWAERRFDQNWVVGAVAAGLLLFLISPLQHLAERLAHRAVPPGAPMVHLPHEDRVRIYREQLEVAWADGTLTQRERLLFAKLQERLALSAEEAVKLENDVVSSKARAQLRAPRRRTAA